jgi:hypothetical protein
MPQHALDGVTQASGCVACTNMVKNRLANGLDHEAGPNGLWRCELVKDSDAMAAIRQKGCCGQSANASPCNCDSVTFCHGPF